MPFEVDGVSASLAPYSQRWRDLPVGTDHNGAPLFSKWCEVDLSFDAASITFHKQWLDIVDGSSHTLDILTRDELGFRTVSPVYAVCENRPDVQSTISQPFTMTIRRVSRT